MANKKLIIIVISFILLIILMGVVTFFFGIIGTLTVMKWILWITLIIGIFGTIIWVVWFLFIKKQKFDATAVNKKKLIHAGTLQCPDSIKGYTLRLSGDKGHSFINFGKIIGYIQVQVLTKTRAYDENGNQKFDTLEGKTIPIYKLDNVPQDIFITQTAKFPLSLFEDEKVIRVDPKDHDELIGDITLFGLNLVPLSEYWYLSSDYLDARKIDMAVLHESERGVMFEMLKDTKNIVDNAINLDARHRKEIEEKQLVEIPQMQQLRVNQ